MSQVKLFNFVRYKPYHSFEIGQLVNKVAVYCGKSETLLKEFKLFSKMCLDTRMVEAIQKWVSAIILAYMSSECGLN